MSIQGFFDLINDSAVDAPPNMQDAPPNGRGQLASRGGTVAVGGITVDPVEADRINLQVVEEARQTGRRLGGVSVTHGLHRGPYGAAIFTEIMKAFVDGLHESIEEED